MGGMRAPDGVRPLDKSSSAPLNEGMRPVASAWMGVGLCLAVVCMAACGTSAARRDLLCTARSGNQGAFQARQEQRALLLNHLVAHAQLGFDPLPFLLEKLDLLAQKVELLLVHRRGRISHGLK